MENNIENIKEEIFIFDFIEHGRVIGQGNNKRNKKISIEYLRSLKIEEEKDIKENRKLYKLEDDFHIYYIPDFIFLNIIWRK